MVTARMFLTSVLSFWRTGSTLAVAGWIAVAMLLLLFIGNTPQTFAFKAFFAVLLYLALMLTLRIITERKVTLIVLATYGAVVGLVNLADPAGPYRFQGGAGVHLVPPGTVIDTWIYTHPKSKRWSSIDEDVFKPYVMVGNVSTDLTLLRLTVNGKNLGRVSEIPGLKWTKPLAVEIPWRVVKDNEYVRVRVMIGGTENFLFSSFTWRPQGWHHRDQTLSIGGKKLTANAFLTAQANLLVQIRLVDNQGHVTGLLF